MSNRLFQGLVYQMRDTVDRMIGVIDESATIIACSDLTKIGEPNDFLAADLGENNELFIRDGITYKPFGSKMKSEYAVFVSGSDDLAAKMCGVLSISLSSIKQYYDEKYDRGNFIKNIMKKDKEKTMIEFNKPPFIGTELEYIRQAAEENNKLCGDGPFTKKCSAWMQDNFNVKHAILTTSCTHALEMAAYLSEIQPGDEVIMPSYTFVSTADAFVLRGAKIVYVDIRPDTMNIDETKIEDAITEKTKAIVPVHYAGVACEMDTIMDIAKRHNLKVVEDAAQGVSAYYKGKALGTIGDFGCYSFHETKNYTMGEGGALLFQDENYLEKAEILREKGTNRSKFFRGQIDKYTWIDYGSSYLPSDMNAAYLLAELEEHEKIDRKRMAIYNYYHEQLRPLAEAGKIEQPVVPEGCVHNAHMYFIKARNLEVRTKLIKYMKERGVMCVFHYVPLHTSPAGQKFGVFHGEDKYTTKESERLMRLPMFYGLSEQDMAYVVECLMDFKEW